MFKPLELQSLTNTSGGDGPVMWNIVITEVVLLVEDIADQQAFISEGKSKRSLGREQYCAEHCLLKGHWTE